MTAVPITLGTPDLVLSAPTAPAVATSGGAVSLSYTLTNAGAFPAAAAWNDRVYISSKPTYRPVGPPGRHPKPHSVDRSPRAATRRRRFRGRSPGHVTPGDYYLLFVADADSQQAESDESNNAQALPIHIDAGDLAVSSIRAPGTGVVGGQVVLSWTVTNQGAQPASGFWSDSVFLSDSPTYDLSAVFLNTFSGRISTPPLAPGASYTQSQTVNIPANSATGPRFLIVLSDLDNRLAETNETNNAAGGLHRHREDGRPDGHGRDGAEFGHCRRCRADLVHGEEQGGLDADRHLVRPGVSLRRRCAGLLRRYPRRDLSDRQPVHPERERHYTINLNVTIPAGSTGNRRLLFVTDAGGAVSELNETNNVFSVPVVVTAPDLTVTAATAPASGVIGKSVDYSYTVKNVGTVDAPAIVSDSVYVSDYPTLDARATLLTHVTGLPGVAARPRRVVHRRVEPHAPGRHEDRRPLSPLRRRREQLQQETDETNNVRVVPFQVQAPDLAVGAIVVPSSAQIGSTIDVTWTLTNLGDGPATGSWYDTVLLSDDDSIGGDTSLANVSFSGTLAAGDSAQITATVTLPAGVSGVKHIVIRADDFAQSRRVERGEQFGHQRRRRSRSGICPPRTCKSPRSVRPASARSGGSITVNWTVANNGPVDATGSWVDRIILAPTGTVLGTITHSGGLASGSHYDGTATVTLPTENDGTYQILVLTDADNAVSEGQDEDDNQAGATPLLVIGHPDLVPSIVSSPASAAAGATVGINWSVANGGTLSADGSWTDYVYLSNSASPASATLYLLGQLKHTGGLTAGGSYASHLDVAIPPDASGPLYILIQTDGNREVDEANSEGNNFISAALLVQQAPYADLAVSAVDVQSAVAVGNPATAVIGWTVVNLGSGAGTTTGWVDRVYSSPAQFTGGPLTLIGEFPHQGALNPGDHYSPKRVDPPADRRLGRLPHHGRHERDRCRLRERLVGEQYGGRGTVAERRDDPVCRPGADLLDRPLDRGERHPDQLRMVGAEPGDLHDGSGRMERYRRPDHRPGRRASRRDAGGLRPRRRDRRRRDVQPRDEPDPSGRDQRHLLHRPPRQLDRRPDPCGV